MIPNTSLVRQCELKATGATIHAVKNALHAYLNYVHLSQDHPELAPKVAEWTARLERFAISGHVQHLHAPLR